MKKKEIEELAEQLYRIYVDMFEHNNIPFFKIDSVLQNFYRTIAKFILTNYTRKY